MLGNRLFSVHLVRCKCYRHLMELDYYKIGSFFVRTVLGLDNGIQSIVTIRSNRHLLQETHRTKTKEEKHLDKLLLFHHLLTRKSDKNFTQKKPSGHKNPKSICSTSNESGIYYSILWHSLCVWILTNDTGIMHTTGHIKCEMKIPINYSHALNSVGEWMEEHGVHGLSIDNKKKHEKRRKFSLLAATVMHSYHLYRSIMYFMCTVFICITIKSRAIFLSALFQDIYFYS